MIAFVLATLLAENGEVFFGIGVTAIACLPIKIGVAITRYRLYDIDLIINRAIVYGTLTAILAGSSRPAWGSASACSWPSPASHRTRPSCS